MSEPAKLKSFMRKVCESGGSWNERDITKNKSNAGVVKFVFYLDRCRLWMHNRSAGCAGLKTGRVTFSGKKKGILCENEGSGGRSEHFLRMCST